MGLNRETGVPYPRELAKQYTYSLTHTRTHAHTHTHTHTQNGVHSGALDTNVLKPGKAVSGDREWPIHH